MTVAQTSRDAEKHVDKYHQQQLVIDAINVLGSSCIADVAAYLNMERSTVSARMNELKADGKIVFVCTRKSNRTGVMSDHYRIATEQDKKPAPLQTASGQLIMFGTR